MGVGVSRRVLVVSAGMGAGHHAAADVLVTRLRSAGEDARRIDLLAVGRPGQGRRLARIYRVLLRRLPVVYDLVMRGWSRWPAPWERLTAAGARCYERGLLAEVAAYRPDAVVSVYNLAGQALGRLKASGRLALPVVTYVVDPGAHPYWISPGVDRHLAVLPQTVTALRRLGAGDVVQVAPLLPLRPAHGSSSDLGPPPDLGPAPDLGARSDLVPGVERGPARRAARRRLCLPTDRGVVLVSGGSWGCGQISRTVDVLAGAGELLPVVVCGRDEGLRRRVRDQLRHLGRGLALGWTGDLGTWFDAADVLVDNAGGVTCWEALSGGLAVVIFRPLPGHGRLNAVTLEEAGLVSYPRTDAQLVPAVRALCGDSTLAALRAARAREALSGVPVEAVLDLTMADGGARAR
jgi:processive 1,2-diacylglycerol beta-glucosyltransferase